MDPYTMSGEDDLDLFGPNSSWWFNDHGMDCPHLADTGLYEMPTPYDPTELPSYGCLSDTVGASTEIMATSQPGTHEAVAELSGRPCERGQLAVDTTGASTAGSKTDLLPDEAALPQLTPTHTSLGDSPVSSLTPSTAHSSVTPTHFNRNVFNAPLELGIGTRHPGLQTALQYETQQDTWTPAATGTQPYHVGGALVAVSSALTWPNAEEVAEFREDIHRVQQSTLQRASTMPSRLPFEQRQHLDQLGLLVGTFELNEDLSTFIRRPQHLEHQPFVSSGSALGEANDVTDNVPHRPPHSSDSCPINRQEAGYCTSVTHAESAVETGIERVRCKECGKSFSGKFASGNRWRHFKQMHLARSVTDSKLTCRKCKTVYKRSDALRNHLWRKHSMLEAKPKTRRTA